MFIDKEHFDGWMRRSMERFDTIERLNKPDAPENRTLMPDGEALLDNADLCRMLNVSKRTLQRYRTMGELPFTMIYHKTYYKESDVVEFIEKHFSRFSKKSGNKE
jgi:hypothetical protein